MFLLNNPIYIFIKFKNFIKNKTIKINDFIKLNEKHIKNSKVENRKKDFFNKKII